jgi:hypothetical protein
VANLEGSNSRDLGFKRLPCESAVSNGALLYEAACLEG